METYIKEYCGDFQFDFVEHISLEIADIFIDIDVYEAEKKIDGIMNHREKANVRFQKGSVKTPFELQYSNNGSFSAANPAIGSGVYIVYDDGTGGEEDTTPAEITGVSITVDGETYTYGNVTITPTSTITLTVTGTNLQNGTEDNIVDYADGTGDPVGPDYFEISEDGSTATSTPPAGRFANSSNFEIVYYNNYTDIENRTAISTGIYLTYDDGIEVNTTLAIGDNEIADGYTLHLYCRTGRKPVYHRHRAVLQGKRCCERRQFGQLVCH